MSSDTITTDKLDAFENLPDRLITQGIAPDKTWAMATSPSECLMLKVGGDGKLLKRDGQPIDLKKFYEITVFCKNWQITATRDGKGAELEILTGDGKEPPIEQQYLVWGKVTSTAKAGWCKVSDPRIGTIDLPAPDGAEKDRQLVLTAIEYIEKGEHCKHGNAMVVRQRLTGIGVYESGEENV